MKNFDWGDSTEWFINTIGNEIFEKKIYEKFFTVKENDIVLDLGASIGPFSYSILDKNPKHIYCVEPSLSQTKTLEKNLLGYPITIINKGISNKEGKDIFDSYGDEIDKSASSVSFKKIVSDYNIEKINFLKTDCEGGEYHVFNIENINWIKNNVKRIVGEWHLNTDELKKEFRIFRDVYLNIFKNHEIYAVDGVNIKWDLWNEHFIEYYNEVIIYINND
jgi:FkbM family methyltransferase